MIGYVTLGTNDLARAIEFYNAVLGELGAKQFMEEPGHFHAWQFPGAQGGLSLTRPYDGNKATPGNGTMVALQASGKEQVDRVHAMALSMGGKDEGAPGQRMKGFYAGYFRDPDGNKLNAFFTG